jgi:hypothetical protein
MHALFPAGLTNEETESVQYCNLNFIWNMMLLTAHLQITQLQNVNQHERNNVKQRSDVYTCVQKIDVRASVATRFWRYPRGALQ